MKHITFALTLCLFSSNVLAATFENLNFESVILPLVPDPNDLGRRVPIVNALPHWSGYVGGVQQTSVYYINRPLSAAALDLFSKDVGNPTLQGNYSVYLGSSPSYEVTISQPGMFP